MNKILLGVFVCFAVLLCISIASASLQITGGTYSLSVYQDDDVSGYFVLNSTENLANVEFSASPLSEIDITFDPDETDLIANTSKRINFTIDTDCDADDGERNITIYANSTNSTAFILKLNIEKSLFCLKIDVDDKFDVGENISMDIDMDAKEDIDFTITAEIVGEDMDVDLDDSLNDGEDDTYTLELKIPYKIDDGDYTLKITIEADEDGSDETQTREEIIPIEINKDRDVLIIDKITIANTPVCGQSLDLSIKVVNAGRDDQDDTIVKIYSSALNINSERTSDINERDTETFYFVDSLPVVAPGIYTLEISAISDDASDYQTIEVDLQTNCKAQIKELSLSTQQTNSAFSGEDSIFSLILDNTGTEDVSYTITISGYSSWALLTNPTITGQLLSGKRKTELVTFSINNDASGQANFKVLVTFDGKTITKNVSFNISKETPTSSGTFWFELKHNIGWAVLIIVLIVIIIVLTTVLSRKPRKVEQPTLKKNNKKKK